MFSFTDRTVVITGAAGNLGVPVVRLFLQAGASLALVDHVHDRLGLKFPELVNSANHVLLDRVNLLDAAAMQRAIQGVQEKFGHIDVLVNTVGGYRGGKSTAETPPDDLDYLLNLNLRTVFNACRAVAPFMQAQRSGRIINIAARSGLAGIKNQSAYSMAKAGVLRLTESLSAELRESGVNVNCLVPTTIDTPQNRESMPKADFSRWTPPEAVADVILFLASDAARAVHGAAIPV